MNKILLSLKIHLLSIKYYYLFLKRNYLYRPKNINTVRNFKKENKVVICGNGPSYKCFEKGPPLPFLPPQT